MAIRQRIWQVYTRPSIILQFKDPKIPNTTIVLSQKTEIHMTNPLTDSKQKIDIPEDSNGAWVKVFESNSYEQVRKNIKQILPSCPLSSIKILEKVPTDTEVIPQY